MYRMRMFVNGTLASYLLYPGFDEVVMKSRLPKTTVSKGP